MPITREQLYAECWAEPMTKVAARHGVSSSFLARVCDRMNVPRPPRGYWAKLAVGQILPKPELPSARPEDEIEWLRDSEQSTRIWVQPVAPAKLPAAPSPARRGSRLTLHPLISGAKRHFEKVRESNNGYLRPFKKLLVDLYVSTEQLDRALDLANSAFQALEELEHPVCLAQAGLYFQRPALDERLEPGSNRYYPNEWRPDRPTITLIGTVAFGLTFYELSEHVEAKYSDGVYIRPEPNRSRDLRRSSHVSTWVSKYDMPSGLLCLRATSPYSVAQWERTWRESKRGDLKNRLPEIIKEIEEQAAPLAELVKKGEEKAAAQRAEWDEQMRRWKREEQERVRNERIEKSRKELLSLVDQWRRAVGIAEFFEEVQRRATQLNTEERSVLAVRAQRAQELLGGTDVLQKLLQWRTPEDLERADSKDLDQEG